MAETWLINENPLSYPISIGGQYRFDCNFISNGQSFTSIELTQRTSPPPPQGYRLLFGTTKVFEFGMELLRWDNPAYRTITFETAPTGDLLTWLQANGTLTPSSSPSTADKLQELLDIKQDIKVAIENKGADLTGIEFDGYAGKIDEIETGGGGLTGGYNVVYRSNYFMNVPVWISITLTFVDDTTASYIIATNGNLPSDWKHYTGNENDGYMDTSYVGPYVWNNVKSVSITAHVDNGTPRLVINNLMLSSATYNATLDKNILVSTGYN